MIKQLALTAAVAFGLSSGAALAAGAGGGHVEDCSFSFEGPFGSYDQMQLQRGLQVYTEVCSACHGLKYVPFRTLGDAGGPGLPEDQVRAYAEAFEVWDPELQDYRTATPTDHFPPSAPRERAGPEPDGQGPRGLPRALRPRPQPALPRHGRCRSTSARSCSATPARRRKRPARSSTRTTPSPAAGSRWRRRSTGTT